MLRELILSVASGVIVAVVMQVFGFGNGRREVAPRQNMRNYNYAPPKRRSFFGRFVRLILSVLGGIAFAQAAAPFILRRGFGEFERFDRFDRFDGWAGDIPILVLTVVGTIVVYMILSALTRR